MECAWLLPTISGCPIDLLINKNSLGIDIFLGYLGFKYKKYSVVDDMIRMRHPRGGLYGSEQARKEREDWYALKNLKKKKIQRFHYWASKDLLKNRSGFILLHVWDKMIEKGSRYFFNLKGHQIINVLNY